MSYATRYLAEAAQIVATLDPSVLERMVSLIVDTRGRGGRLLVLGVGGGAGHASHAVADFRKIAGIEAYSPSDKVLDAFALTGQIIVGSRCSSGTGVASANEVDRARPA